MARVAIIVMLLCGTLVSQPSASGPSLTLLAGQPVVMSVTAGTTSERAKPGDVVRLEVIQAVRADDLVAIREGAEVEAVVQSVRRRGHRGAPGMLELAFREVRTLTGERVPLAGVAKRQGDDKRNQNDRDVSEAVFQTFGFGAPLAPIILMQKGGSARLDPGLRIIAALGEPVVLDRDQLARSQPAAASTVATIFLLHGWHPTCGSVRLPFDDYLKSTVRLEVPPGKYWFHAGATGSLWRGIGAGMVGGFTFGAAMPQPVSLKVLRRPVSEFTALDAKAGHTYYLLAIEDPKIAVHWRVTAVDSAKGAEMVTTSDAPYYILRDFTPEALNQLQSAPAGIPQTTP